MAGTRGLSKKHLPKGVVILYEDRDIIVANKEAGVLTVATDDGDEHTAYSALTNYVMKGDPRCRRRIFIVHRIDRETSGVLVFAKTEEAKRKLQDHWDETEKTYLAIVEGRPPTREGTIESYLAENSVFKVFSTPDPAKGKLAKTRWRVIKQEGPRALLEVSILTGRKHQIRVHMADQGWPIAGDAKYGTKIKGSRHIGLHAKTLVINHPFSGARMTFEAPVPPWFHALLRGPKVVANEGGRAKDEERRTKDEKRKSEG